MKKFIAILGVILLFTSSVEVKAQASLQWPFGTATTSTITLTAAKQLTYTLTTTAVKNSMNLIKIAGYSALGLDTTLNVTININSELKKGSILSLTLGSDATARTVTFSGGFYSTTLSGTSSKQKTATFIFDGNRFVGIGQLQNN